MTADATTRPDAPESGEFVHRGRTYGWVVHDKNAGWTYAVYAVGEGNHFARIGAEAALDAASVERMIVAWLAGREQGILDGMAAQSAKFRALIGL